MKRILGLYLVLGILISSCNLPAAGAPDPQFATAAALTVQAALNAITPLASPTVVNSEIGTATKKAVSTPTFTQPMASVGDVVNCRKGPGTNYERVTQILPAESVKIIGFFSPNYWIVSTKDGDCWLSGEFATPVGSFAAVPTVTAPPTTEGKKPEEPALKNWTFSCTTVLGQTDITLSWTDKANDEAGYRVFRNDELAADLPANSTTFAETIPSSGLNIVYKIQVYNIVGENSISVTVTTCP